MNCPEKYHPGCCCYSGNLEPSDNCYLHGCPNTAQCPYCGLFRGRKPCKRCGCVFGLEMLVSLQSYVTIGLGRGPVGLEPLFQAIDKLP